jgi:hypothetical protein
MPLQAQVQNLQIHFGALAQILRIDVHARIFSRRRGHPGVQIHRNGHHETFIVIGVLADQIHASRRPKYPRFLTVQFLELLAQALRFALHQTR